MSMHPRLGRIASAGVAAFALITIGCTTNPDGTMSLDERATGAMIGAVLGCAVARAGGDSKDCLRGAAVGAAAGLVAGWYFESKKVAPAPQVNTQWRKVGFAIPRDEVRPVEFRSRVARRGPADAQGRKEIQVTSNTDLIGYGDRVPQLTQKYAIYDENNRLIEEKSERIASVDGAGRYETQSRFKVPDQAGKSYTVKTSLISGGKTFKENSYKISLGVDVAPVRFAETGDARDRRSA